jgi:NADH dehydrogenase FAD-containing subunit
LRAAGLDPLLIAPRFFHYSGLAGAVLSGALPVGANRIDVAALARRRGLAFKAATALAVAGREIVLHDGNRVGFDLLSLNIGSEVARPIAGKGYVWPAKPLDRLARLRSALEERITGRPHIVVAGAGWSGTEIAASIAALYERAGETARITLAGSPEPGPGWSGVYRSLARRGIVLLPDRQVAERRRHKAVLDDGAVLPCDYLVAATGLAPGPLGRRVNAALQAVDDPAVFASGDCAFFMPGPLPSSGVFGVRQAPVLAHNLGAWALGEPMLAFQPRRVWLSIMDLGTGQGFARWGPLWSRSATALRWKRRLDLAFVRRFQV